jgi:hypothetical protein
LGYLKLQYSAVAHISDELVRLLLDEILSTISSCLYPTLTAMPDNRIHCCTHGDQGIGLVCIHAATAMDHGESSGFFCSDNTDLARPDAWCNTCEERLERDGWSQAWFNDADFKILCAACWDVAKERLGSTSAKGT